MPTKRRSSVSSGTRTPAKLFKCTGFGSCNMVFTRSEHLARHQRKHTGEKPYKCIVPGCERMFSRFDNMMQHTQTHDKNKKPKTHTHYQKYSQNNISNEHQQQRHSIDSYRPSNSRSPQFPSISTTMNSSTYPAIEPPVSMVDSKILPLPNTRRVMPTDSSFPHPPSSDVRLPMPQDDSYRATNQPRNRFSWPLKRDAHPYYQHPPGNGFYPDLYAHHLQPISSQQQHSHPLDDIHARRLSSASTNSSESTLPSPISAAPLPPPTKGVVGTTDTISHTGRRRISIDDLRLPIESIQNIHLSETTDPSAHSLNKQHEYPTNNQHNYHSTTKTVDITTDELEALEGFGKFHSTSVIASSTSPPFASSELSPVLRTGSPNIASEVCAMRQRVMSLNESFQRV